jgi:hypothetical protein
MLMAKAVQGGVLTVATGAALFGAAGAAWGGPCTTQIAQLQQQINLAAADPAAKPDIGPTAPQSVGAQLHHQPTPGSVEHGERVANADADAALERARKADADGNSVACNQALGEARRLYGIE